ncbi:hypothetical protein ACG7TL_007921 [Trametes sanguinea]
MPASPLSNAAGALPLTPETGIHLGNFGAILVGCYLGLVIYGVIVYQTYSYFKAYPDDHLYLKCLVTSVLLWESCHAVLCMDICYHFLVTNYSNAAALLKGHISINMLPLFTGLSVISCQIFFMRRVYLLVSGRSRLVIAAMVAFILAELGRNGTWILNMYPDTVIDLFSNDLG